MEIFSQEQHSHHVQRTAFVPSLRSEATSPDNYSTIVSALADRRAVFDTALSDLAARAAILSAVATRLVNTLRNGYKVLVAGNGGSAAEAQHFAAELVGRFKRERAPYAVLSLTTDTAILTAIANDYGYSDIFARQVLALGNPGDMFIAFSTSGQSENVIRAAVAAQQSLMTVVAITGDLPSRLEHCADFTVKVPLVDTPLVQELHMMVTHLLCDIAESQLSTIPYAGKIDSVQYKDAIDSVQDEWQR